MAVRMILIIMMTALLSTALHPSSALAQRTYSLVVNQVGFKQQGGDDTAHIAYKGSRFRIVDSDDKTITVQFLELTTDLALTQKRSFSAGSAAALRDVSGIPPVSMAHTYEIDTIDMRRYNYRIEYGLDGGLLTVPFKLQFEDGEVSAAATLGPYIGWRQRLLGIPSILLASAGLTVVPVQDVNSSTVESKLGVTIAGGLVAEIARQFQLGIVVGMDHLGGEAGKTYKYQDNGWISFAIGYGFVQ